MALVSTAGQYVIWMAYLLLGISVYLVARMLLREQEVREAQERLEEVSDIRISDPIARMLQPFYRQYLVPVVRGKPFWDIRRTVFRRKLVSAGMKDELTADEIIALKILLIVVFPLLGSLLKVLGMMDVSWIWIPLSGVLGWFYPNFILSRKIERRRIEILKSMPFIVDLLALTTEAGLDFIGAIGKVVEKANPSPLIDELEQLLKEIKVGASRNEAMREMSNRIDLKEVRSFIAILISADQMGAPIGKTLRQQSETIRSDRFVRAEKAGAAASQKLLLPLVFFILPAVLLMVFGPFFLSFLGSGGAR